MWLRDQLPHDFPTLRIMIYGYDTKLLKSESFQTIDDLATTLITHMRAIGKALASTRPVLFFAHSLGGLILKRALCFLATSGEADAFMLEKIQMILFFGVPSSGMKMTYLLPMVDGQPNKSLIERLSEDDNHGYLKWLNDTFSGISRLRKIRLISAYETQRTKTAQVCTPMSTWQV